MGWRGSQLYLGLYQGQCAHQDSSGGRLNSNLLRPTWLPGVKPGSIPNNCWVKIWPCSFQINKQVIIIDISLGLSCFYQRISWIRLWWRLLFICKFQNFAHFVVHMYLCIVIKTWGRATIIKVLTRQPLRLEIFSTPILIFVALAKDLTYFKVKQIMHHFSFSFRFLY